MEIQFFNYVYGCNQITSRIVLSPGDVKVLEIANSLFFLSFESQCGIS
jgi:hypothetical protein